MIYPKLSEVKNNFFSFKTFPNDGITFISWSVAVIIVAVANCLPEISSNLELKIIQSPGPLDKMAYDYCFYQNINTRPTSHQSHTEDQPTFPSILRDEVWRVGCIELTWVSHSCCLWLTALVEHPLASTTPLSISNLYQLRLQMYLVIVLLRPIREKEWGNIGAVDRNDWCDGLDVFSSSLTIGDVSSSTLCSRSGTPSQSRRSSTSTMSRCPSSSSSSGLQISSWE